MSGANGASFGETGVGMSLYRGRRVTVAGRSWESREAGLYCFEATIDGEPTEIHVSEEVAFNFRNAWTPNTGKCLEILRLHRADLARMLEWKLHARHRPSHRGSHLITWRDSHRVVTALEALRTPSETGAEIVLLPA